ncbi:MAG: HAD family hydrolase [Elusimicrobia bacterium]|nr:HAD family hydrolase [Elusimicrobiota bacterium]
MTRPDGASAVMGIALDFDGVVLESVDAKTRAFERLFAPEGPENARRIVDFHVANGGISRFEKFRWAYREVLRRPLPPVEEARLGERFNALVEETVSRCDWVPGAREFIESWHARLPLYVASGTPEDELRRIVARRGLDGRFRGVYGSPARKDAILGRVAAELGAQPGELVLVGDAMNDHDAAAAAGCRFVGRALPGGPAAFPPGTTVLADLRGLAATLGL